MPSETSVDTSGVKTSASGVTQPFVTETYRCVSFYETKDTKNRPFKVEADEMLDVLIKEKGGQTLHIIAPEMLAFSSKFPAEQA